MKTPAERGRFGDWLARERMRRYPTQLQALADMERSGLRISASEFSQWESGSRVPRENNPKVVALYEFFGSTPDATEAASDLSGVVAAIDRLTAAIEAQTQARAAWERGLTEGLGELLRAGTPSGDPAAGPRALAPRNADRR